MVPKRVEDLLDRRISALAARQHGVVSVVQLLTLGLSRRAVSKRAQTGRLHRVHRGVYAVGHPRLTLHGRLFAAVLACGEGAVISHNSAACLWRLPHRETPRIDVTVPRPGGRRARRTIVVHRAELPAQEVACVDGIPVTTPARTLLDLADVVPRRALERAMDEAEYLRLDLTGLEPRHGRRGSGLLARVLAEHEPGSTLTSSQLEEQFLRLCRRNSLPRPEVNASLEGYPVDFLWRVHRLVVETDGHAAHGTRAAFERDRVRDADLTAAGWRVLRITHRRLATDRQQVAALLRGLLGAS